MRFCLWYYVSANSSLHWSAMHFKVTVEGHSGRGSETFITTYNCYIDVKETLSYNYGGLFRTF